MTSLLFFLAVLAILVLSHEFGHFIAAKKTGMKVCEFGFGFPPRIFGIQFLKEKKIKKLAEVETIEANDEIVPLGNGENIVKEIITDTIREIDEIKEKRSWRFVWWNRPLEEADELYGTVYSLNLLPLGGFVKIKGENGEDASDPQSFAAKKIWQRAIVLSAGVVFNILLAMALLSVGYFIGLPQSLDGVSDVSGVNDRRIEVLGVLVGKPAEKAGVASGDIILQVGDLQNPRLRQMQNYVDENRDKNIFVKISRNGEIIEKKIIPEIYKDSGKAGFGVSIAEVGTVKYSFFKAIYHGIITTVWYVKEIFIALFFLIKGLLSGAGASEAVSGPVGIAVMTGRAARLGIIYLIQFTAMLSLNLAIFNFLPIPALDGGRLLFLGIAKLRGRPVAQKVEGIFHTVGFALLMLLVIFVTVRDIAIFRSTITGFISRIF
jgi:regulator of sigma E protease